MARQSDTLDVLVNNAGVATGGYTAPTEASLDDMHAVYEVNVFGPVRVTQAFVPFLRKAGQGRIVMMSSSLGSIGEQLDMTSGTYGVNLLGYNSSKSALNMITVSFAKELAAHGIKVNAANPGYVATDLNNNQGYRSVEQGAAIAVHLATPALSRRSVTRMFMRCFFPHGRFFAPPTTASSWRRAARRWNVRLRSFGSLPHCSNPT